MEIKYISYYLIIFICTFLSAIKNKMIRASSFILMIIIAGLRYNTGMDYMNYYKLYEFNRFGHERFLHTEPLFYYLMKVFNFFELNYYFLIFFLSAMGIIIIYKCYFKGEKRIYLGVFLFLIINKLYFNIIAGSALRQSVGVLFFILANEEFLKKRYLRYLLAGIIGILFHKSTVIFLIIPIVYKLKKFMFKVLPIVCLIIIIFQSEFVILLKYILEIVRLDIYVRDYLEGIQINLKSLKNLYYFIFLFQYCILYFKYEKFQLNKKESFYLKMLLIGLLINFLLISNISMLHRLLPYFYIYYIPLGISVMKKKIIPIKYIVMLFSFLFLINHVKEISRNNSLSKYYTHYSTIINKNIEFDYEVWLDDVDKLLRKEEEK